MQAEEDASMKQKQDGKAVAAYVEETEEDIAKLVSRKGDGGAGNHEALSDAERRGITPELAAELAKAAAARKPDKA